MDTKILSESFSLLRKNPILYLPDLVMIGLTYLLVYVLYLYTGAAQILPLLQSAEAVPMDILRGYLTENLGQIIISTIIFFIVTFVLGVGVVIYKFSMIREMISGKKISLFQSWKEKHGFFWPVVFTRVLVFIISMVAIGLVVALSALVYFLFSLGSPAFGKILAILVGILATIALLLLVQFAILFRYPIMFMTKTRHPVQVLRKSYDLFKKNKSFVLIAWLIILVINIIFGAITYVLSTLITTGISFITIATLAAVFSVLWTIINIIIDLTAEIWTQIYLFLKYKNKFS